MSRQVGGLGTAVYNPGGTSLSTGQHDWSGLRPWSVGALGRLLGQTVAERGMERRARDDRVQRHDPEGSYGFDRGADSDSDLDPGYYYVDHDHGHLVHPDGDGAVDWYGPGPGAGVGRGHGPVGGRS